MFDKTLDYFRENANSLTEVQSAVDRRRIHETLLSVLPNDRHLNILDIGAGSGETAALFASMGHFVVAAEPVQALTDIARQKFRDSRIAWTADALPKLSGVSAGSTLFDAITMKDVIHFLDEQRRNQALRKVFSLTAVGGYVDIQYPLQVPNKYQRLSDGEIRTIVDQANNHPNARATFSVQHDAVLDDHLGRTDRLGASLKIKSLLLRRDR